MTEQPDYRHPYSTDTRKLLTAREHLLEAQRLLSAASFTRSPSSLSPIVRVNGDMHDVAESALLEYVHSQLVERAKAHAAVGHALAVLESGETVVTVDTSIDPNLTAGL